MKLKWTSKAQGDLARLHAFLAKANPTAASRLVRSLVAASTRLLAAPRIGERLDEFHPREVRRIIVAHYEVRYEIQAETLFVLRIWHARENR
ncbi:MAG: type II toxin-antitoxin system RelE/ParE family toxin [Elusimicrobia bacterium]|nr:type II toxin-antitoxin system RelE/ParE family toxin [Elusimicrobiota bacterium]